MQTSSTEFKDNGGKEQKEGRGKEGVVEMKQKWVE